MVGLVNVKVTGVHIPDLSRVNEAYWKYDWNVHELEGVGYVCPSCGRTQIVKTVNVDENRLENEERRQLGEPSGY
jgi:hypothetical protein